VALSVMVRLREGRYDAAGLDPAAPEWPPHPARLFCALVASAVDYGDDQALRWLEAAGLPQVWASSETATSRSAGFVVVNATGGRGSQTWPGRGNGWRKRAGVLAADDTYVVEWLDADPDDLTLARLVRLAGRVPYVGRSTSSAEVSVLAGPAAPRPGWTCWLPVELGTPRSVALRVPFAGYLDALRAVYDDGTSAWQVATRTVAYAPPTPVGHQPQPGGVDGPYADLLVWGVRRPSVPIGGDDLFTVTEALRRTVLARVADPLPEQVSGHGADGRPHVAYLGLIDVGHPHADGHLLGLGVAIPRDMPDGARRALLRGLLGPAATAPLDELRAGRGRHLQLQYAPTAGRGLQPQRWRHPHGARRWVSVTPMMLDRFPNRRIGLAACVSRSLVTAGYPEPVDVQPLPAPAIAGGVHRVRTHTVSRGPQRPMLHCRVTFPEPVHGPVLAGALRYLGGGLFVPEGTDADN
jgi:CRISPR-associated protein Csb2